jgi:hypothetical protein
VGTVSAATARKAIAVLRPAMLAFERAKKEGHVIEKDGAWLALDFNDHPDDENGQLRLPI